MNVNNKELSAQEVKEIINACNGKTLDKNNKPSHKESILVLEKYFGPSFKDDDKNKTYSINQPLPGQGLWTALTFATFFGKNEEAMALLKMGANPNITIEKEISVLEIAAAEGNEKLCEKYIYKGAKINYQSSLGRTALMGACENGHIDVVDVFIPHKPNVMARDNDNKTCIDYAKENGHYQIISKIENAVLASQLSLNDSFKNNSNKKVSKI